MVLTGTLAKEMVLISRPPLGVSTYVSQKKPRP